MATPQARPLAVVTGASSGIGYEIAKICAGKGMNLVIVADERDPRCGPEVPRDGRHGRRRASRSRDDGWGEPADAGHRRSSGVRAGRRTPVAASDAPSSIKDSNDIRRVIDTNVTGTVYLLQRIGRECARNEGRILIVGSIAGFMPGTYQAV